MSCFVLYAGNQEENFLRANKAYKEKEYKQALELYQSIRPKGPAIWENIGNCFYALGDYAQAIIAFKRAEFGTLKQCKTIQQKINAVYHKLDYPIESNWLEYAYTYIKCMISGISLLSLQLLFLLLWFIFFFCIYKGRQGKKYRMISALLFGVLVVIGVMTLVKYKEHMQQIGIVLPKTTEVFAGPDKNFYQLGSLNRAQEINIQDERSGWYKIQYKKITGWVRADAIEKI